VAATAPLRAVEREMRVWRRLWRGSVFTQFLQPVLYLLAMGVGLGGLVNAAGTKIDGLTYLEFVAPGLMAATALQNATGDSMWPVMAGFKWMGFYHGMVATPMRPSDVYLGHVLWAGIRLMLGATAFFFVAVVLGAVLSPWGVLAIPAAALCALALAAPLTAYAATQETDHKFGLIFRFLALPMFLFSGTFFPISQLPAWMQPLAWLSPLWHGVVLCRSATTGILPPGGVAGLAVHVLVLGAFIAGGTAWGYRSFTRRLGA
jgi:lipooligosaccharide transport system permease protein